MSSIYELTEQMIAAMMIKEAASATKAEAVAA